MGDRAVNLKKALEFLQGIGRLCSESSVYETEPMDMAPGTRSFYNMAVGFHSRLFPLELLAEIKKFEQKMGRAVNPIDTVNPAGSDVKREGRIFLSRPIDIDILLAEGCVINTPELTVPHERMAERAFVMLPLNEIAPAVIHPLLKKTNTEILFSLQATVPEGSVKKLEPAPRFLISEPGDL